MGGGVRYVGIESFWKEDWVVYNDSNYEDYVRNILKGLPQVQQKQDPCNDMKTWNKTVCLHVRMGGVNLPAKTIVAGLKSYRRFLN